MTLDAYADHFDEQSALNAVPSPVVASAPEGVGTVETYTVEYDRTGTTGVIVGRLEDGSRFLATTRPGDTATIDALLDERPFGIRVRVVTEGRDAFASVDEASSTAS